MAKAEALAQIRSRYDNLSPAEKKVADFVLAHSAEVVRMPMAAVANSVGVSDPTVLRFCRSVGYHGYLELKIALARSTASPIRLIQESVSRNDDKKTIANKVFTAGIQALQDTLSILDDAAFTKAVDVIARARKVLIAGVGTSGPIAHIMYNRLFRIGVDCVVETDSYLQLMEASLLTSRDVAVAISQTGSSIDPVLTLREAKKHGVSTIAVCGTASSPLTKEADIVLLSVSRELRAEAVASRIAQIAIIEAIYVVLAMQNIERTAENERKIWDAVVEKTG